MKKNVKRLGFVVAAIAATTTVGAGIASWQVTGVSVSGGESPGMSASKEGLTLVTTAPAGLFPTKADAGNVTATVTNPNGFDVTLSSASVTEVVSTCGAAPTDFSFGATTFTKAVAAKSNGSAATLSIPITLVKNSLPDACSSVAIAFRVTASGASS